MDSPRRMARTALIAVGIAVAGFGLACSNDVTGPDPGAEERALVRRIEASDAAACIAEYQRVIPLLPTMTPLERIAEIRRILAICQAPSSPGTLQVDTSTTGDDIDPDGYSVSVSGQTSQAVGVNGSVSFPNLAPGNYQVQLTEVAANCTVAGLNPRTVAVSSGSTATTTFTVTCETGPPPPGPEGVIVFTSDQDGSLDIYAMNADGSNQVQLTNDGNQELHSRISTDGQRIVFVSNADGDREIYIMDIDGSNVTQLTMNGVRDQEARISPDGTRIVFERQVAGVDQVFVMDVDGTDQTQLTFETSASGEPAWSPDGTQIVFSSTRLGGREVWMMDADGSDPVRLTNSIGINGDPVWFGTQIAFESSRSGSFEILVMNDDGTNQVAITSGGTNSIDPHWSPDGTMLTFERANDVFTMDADGSDVVNRTNSAANDHNPSWGPGSISS